MEAHNSCLNTRAIIDYIERRNLDPQLLLEGLDDELRGIPDPLNFLRDLHNWVSSDVCAKMYANARRITNDEQAAFVIGFESVTHRNLGYVQEIFVKALATPRSAIERLKTINNKFNRNKDIEVVEVSRRSAVVRLHWNEDLNVVKDFCMMNQGVYTALPIIWGVPPTDLIETHCQFEGDEFCQYKLQWENPSILRRIKLLLHSRKSLLSETLDELEREKVLLENKFAEVRGLNQHLQSKIDQLLSIQQASAAVLSELDYQRLFPSVLQLFIEVIGYSRGLIMLVDDQARVLRYQQGVGGKGEELSLLKGYEIPLSRQQNILARVASSGQAVISEDATALNLNPDNLIIKSYRPSSIVILPLMAQGRVIGILAADREVSEGGIPRLDRDYLAVFANQVALAIENARMYQSQRDNYLRTVQSLAMALEAKDPYTRGHSERVAQYSTRLAERLGLPARKVERIRSGCMLHDIGKIGVDRRVLNKPAKLAPDEFETIKQHPVSGHGIVAPLGLSREEMQIVRHHHERFDGKGYPDRICSSDISLEVRIVTLCDAFDAMTSDRPYRPGLELSASMEQLEMHSGTQFDPKLVRIFSVMVNEGSFNDLLSPKDKPSKPEKRLRVVKKS